MFSHKEYDSMPKMKHINSRFRIRSDGDYDVTLRRDSEDPISMRVTRSDEGVSIIKIESKYESDYTIKPELLSAWYEFKQRPEYYVGLTLDTSLDDLDALQDTYERLLVGVAFTRAARNDNFDPDSSWSKINKCLEWLRTTDFYTCPASTIYHDAVKGGLVSHTLNVVNRIVDIAKTESFKHVVNIEDAILVSMVHDWCKIGLYDAYVRNVKNEQTGKWEQVEAYRYKDEPMSIMGHGVSSMYLASKFFHLSVEEALAVRWHMGWTRVVDSEMNELQHSNEKYPLVHLLQFADQLAIVSY